MTPQATSALKALAILCLATTTLVVSVTLMERDQVAQRTVLLEISNTTSHFELRSDKSPQGCWGALTTTFSSATDSKTINLSGFVSLTQKGQPIHQEFQGSLNFNAFNQLFASVITAPSAESELRVGLLEIDPIIVKFVRASKNTNSVSVLMEQKIPGPVILVENNDSLQIAVSSLRWAPHSPGISLPLGIQLVPATSIPCTPSSAQPLDVTPIMDASDRILSLISGQLEQAKH